MATENDSAYDTPFNTSIGKVQRGFVINEYEEKITVNARNVMENVFM
jgi:hypothetical protein